MNSLIPSTKIPISIATAIAMQAICGFDADGLPLKTGSTIKDYRALYLNVRTLCRNFIGSQDFMTRKSLTANDIIYGIVADLRIIKEVLSRYTPLGIKIIPYICSYASLQQIFPKAVFRQAATDIQKENIIIENNVLSHFIDSVKQGNTGIKIFDTRFHNTKEEETLILTHCPVDLLNAKCFKKLVLLESHTGKQKTNIEWNSKLKNFKKEHTRIPFNEITLQLFGDTGDMFFPKANPKIKARIVEIAEKYKWNPLTTKDRIINNVRLEHEPMLAGILMEHNTGF